MKKLLTAAAVALFFGTGTAYAEQATGLIFVDGKGQPTPTPTREAPVTAPNHGVLRGGPARMGQEPRHTVREGESKPSLMSVDRFRARRFGQEATISILGIEVGLQRDSDTGQISFDLFGRRR